MAELEVLHRGHRSDRTRALKAAMNRRLRARGLAGMTVPETTMLSSDDLISIRKCAWALGALSSTYEAITRTGQVSVGVQRMIRNPGLRTHEQEERGKARISRMRRDRVERARHEKAILAKSHGRLTVVHNVLVAASNYRANPGAYHYFAGGRANLIYLRPTPRDYRSDCSQFASSAQKDAGLPDLGPNGPLWVNTVIMAAHLEVVEHPSPADFGMYGPRHAPHHVEVYCGAAGGPGHEFVGHGSPPIDSLTPGRPDFYLANPIGAR